MISLSNRNLTIDIEKTSLDGNTNSIHTHIVFSFTGRRHLQLAFISRCRSRVEFHQIFWKNCVIFEGFIWKALNNCILTIVTVKTTFDCSFSSTDFTWEFPGRSSHLEWKLRNISFLGSFFLNETM